ncbi:hypothetical protein [Microlunatus parietis]|uniref:Uncharacterized protein n=1 Tax=Microlunatus parietis TaxID=682979 RepID=A0A7Y9I270_9ACTN|nr:hypothetical protein [Microlunatus parietis]NYE68861.1 hypothetical protein [Microlunatus parietis]
MTDIQVEGIDEAVRFLSRLPAAVDRASDDAAADVGRVEVPRIRARAGQVGRREALAVRSVRASADGIEVGAGGGVPAAIFFGAEFGGGARPRTRQFAPYRADGHFLFPQLRDDEERIVDLFADALDPRLGDL